MVVYRKFAALTVCLVLVFMVHEVFSVRLISHHIASSSLAPYLGKEYVLDWSEDSEKTLQVWNYSYCEKWKLENYPYVIKLSEENGEFHLTAELKPWTMKFQLGKEFEFDNGRKCTITLNGTTLILKVRSSYAFLDFTADEMTRTDTYRQQNYTTFWKPRQVQKDSTCCKPLFGPSQRTQSNVAPALAPALGKEYALEHSIINQETFKDMKYSECEIDFGMNTWAIIKLTEDQDELVLSAIFEVINTRFQLGKTAVDNTGLKTMFTLDGTTLTQVPDHSFGHRPRTTAYKFSTKKLQIQEVFEDSNSSLIFKPRNSSLS